MIERIPQTETNHRNGSVEVIAGSMVSGKTDKVIRRLRRARIARQNVQVFKPIIDNRYSENNINSHSGSEFEATPVNNAQEINELLETETTVIAIDEAQFFDGHIIEVANELADSGKRVIVAGLDTDFRGEPFGSMPELMAGAERLDKIHAICMVCGGQANCTQRLLDGKPAHADDDLVVVGGLEMYEARCREHHEVSNKLDEM